MSSQAHWSDDDINTLVTFLLAKKSTAGDGIGFKGSIWTEAATAVNAIPPTKGMKKTSGSCKSKWGKLKETYNIVADIKAQSGFKWDDERGADIDETTAEVWAAYEKKHKGSAPFRNKGWTWYEKVQPLVPNTPRGANVYHASSGTQPQLPDVNFHASDEDEDHPFSHWSATPPPDVRNTAPTTPNAAATTAAVIVATAAVTVNVAEHEQSGADVVQTPALSAKWKRSILPDDGVVLVKCSRGSDHREPRPSGAVALHGMNDRLDDFTDAFRDAFSVKKSGVEATPSRKMRAMKH